MGKRKSRYWSRIKSNQWNHCFTDTWERTKSWWTRDGKWGWNVVGYKDKGKEVNSDEDLISCTRWKIQPPRVSLYFEIAKLRVKLKLRDSKTYRAFSSARNEKMKITGLANEMWLRSVLMPWIMCFGKTDWIKEFTGHTLQQANGNGNRKKNALHTNYLHIPGNTP